MKIVTSENGVIIYPFVKPDSDVVGFRERIEIWPDGTMNLFWDNKVRLDAEAAQKLIEGLLRAVEVAKKGRKPDYYHCCDKCTG